MIPYGRQEITQQDIDSVTEVLQSDFLTQGPQIPLFEQNLASYCGAEHAVAVNSGTAALHLACLALGVGPGDMVWTSPISFVASANCALYCGAGIDFVDIDPETANLCVKKLRQKLERAERNKTLPQVIIPVHLAGQPCDMKEIKQLADQYGFKIIEDACHAIGGRYDNEPVGNCRYSDITVFSFHPVKIITTCEGGAATTNDKALAEKMQLLRTHGITRDETLMTKVSDGPWYYQQIDLGFNYRITDLQAALGTSQLKRVDEVVAKRHQLVQRYNEKLKKLPLLHLKQTSDGYSSYHLYIIRIQTGETDISHLEIFSKLREMGIGVNLHYIPIHTQPYYLQLGFKPGQFPEAEKYYSEAITLPLFHHLRHEDQDRVIECLSRVLR